MSKKTDTARGAGEEIRAEIAEAAKTTAAEPKPAKTKKPGARVYCGPSVRNVVRQYTVYNGDIPDALDAFLTAHPLASNLLVPLDAFAETRRKLETKGTAEAILYQKVKSDL